MDKPTKNTKRYADGAGHNLYLKEEEVAELENPNRVRITVEKID